MTEVEATIVDRRTLFGGFMGKVPSVISNTKATLACFTCGDDTLYHDAWAYWNEETDDLLCPSCFKKLAPGLGESYEKVITFH